MIKITVQFLIKAPKMAVFGCFSKNSADLLMYKLIAAETL